MIEEISNIGDIIAIPFFAWLVYYFHRKEKLSIEEIFLFVFVICGFILDLLFTFIYFRRKGVTNIHPLNISKEQHV